MFGGLVFMVGGHMCCGVIGDRLVVRVGPERTKDALDKPQTGPMDFTGRRWKAEEDGRREGGTVGQVLTGMGA